jgi:hypothetical protein
VEGSNSVGRTKDAHTGDRERNKTTQNNTTLVVRTHRKVSILPWMKMAVETPITGLIAEQSSFRELTCDS